MEPLALTFDLGTQSLRAVLVDPTGSIVSYVQKKFERTYVSPKPGQAEQDADFFWHAIVSASRELKERSGSDWERIVCVSLTTVRDSIVLIDKEGVPVRPLILWLDKRETEMPPLSFKDRAIFAAVGMTKARSSPVRAANTGPKISGMISPALRRTTISPIRTPLR